MKVGCIKKPNRQHMKRDITSGRVYSVINGDSNHYYLIGDDGEPWYYPKDHFE